MSVGQLIKCLPTNDGATVECVGPVVRVSLSHPFPAMLVGLVGSGSGYARFWPSYQTGVFMLS